MRITSLALLYATSSRHPITHYMYIQTNRTLSLTFNVYKLIEISYWPQFEELRQVLEANL